MIRKYTDTDLEQVLEIWYQASTLAHPFLEDSFVEKVKKDMREIYLPNPNAQTWIMEKDQTPIAFISMLGNEIGGLFVSPQHHSRGVGTALVNHVHTMHDQLEVEVFKNNKIGRPFYEKYGFQLLKEYFQEASQQVVLRMKWEK